MSLLFRFRLSFRNPNFWQVLYEHSLDIEIYIHQVHFFFTRFGLLYLINLCQSVLAFAGLQIHYQLVCNAVCLNQAFSFIKRPAFITENTKDTHTLSALWTRFLRNSSRGKIMNSNESIAASRISSAEQKRCLSFSCKPCENMLNSLLKWKDRTFPQLSRPAIHLLIQHRWRNIHVSSVIILKSLSASSRCEAFTLKLPDADS